jgi:type VI protein secretion system component VasK
MTTVLVTLAVVAAVVAVTVGLVSWRDRRRRATDEDPAAVRAARGEQHRRAAEREHVQHEGWNNGGHGFTG